METHSAWQTRSARAARSSARRWLGAAATGDIRSVSAGVRCRRGSSGPGNTSRPRWPGEMPAPPFRLRLCGRVTAWLLARRVSGIWNAGPGPWASFHGRGVPDACEIGYTWLARPAVRTGANTEAKFLMLTHAFEVWRSITRLLSYRREERTVAGGARADRREARRHFPRPPHGRGLHPEQFGALFDSGRRSGQR